jgi:hypothetical protein
VGQIGRADPRWLQGRAFRSAGAVHRHLAHRAAGLQALADRAALRDQKERLEKELKQLKTQQAVAADRAASKTQTEALYQQVLDAQKALEDFRRAKP